MESIIEKIRKLIAHERSARNMGSTAEAEAFAERIQKMLLEHKVSLSEVDIKSLDTDDPIGYTAAGLKSKRIDKWRVLLAFGIANNLFCMILSKRTGGGESDFIFIGRESDRTAASEMYHYLSGVGEDLSFNFVRRNIPSVDTVLEREKGSRNEGNVHYAKKIHRRMTDTVQKDFLTGFVTAICRRLESSRKFIEGGASESAKGLILRDRETIELYAKEQFQTRKPKVVNSPKIILPSASMAGYKAGMRVELKSKPALRLGK
jgi:hypothetical protein